MQVDLIDVARFERKFVKEPSGCWAWMPGPRRLFHLGDHKVYAQRLAWELYGGRGALAAHEALLPLCPNRQCIAPAHFQIGVAANYAATEEERARVDVGPRANERRATFLANVTVLENGCWHWKKASNQHGYGVFSLNNKAVSAHKASLILFRGVTDFKEVIRHRCHLFGAADGSLIRRCVNPAHLEPGTQQENMQDVVEAGRLGYGTRMLSDEEALALRAEYNKRQGEISRLAKKYGVSPTTVCDVLAAKNSWQHLTFSPKGVAPSQEPVETHYARGEAHPRALYADDAVLWLRFFYNEGVNAPALVQTFGGSMKTISDALRGTTYKHLPMPQYKRLSGPAKFTADQVRAIRADAAAGMMQKDIATTYDVTPDCIMRIVNRRTYAEVE